MPLPAAKTNTPGFNISPVIIWVNALVLALLLAYSVYRDVQFEKMYPGDLRNRQVGARLIKDGRLPYFYKWKQGETLRYYDPDNIDGLKVSVITATPFFHRLLMPVCNMPFSSFAIFWLCLQYVCFAITVLLAVQFCSTVLAKLVVLNTAVIFLFTEAWIMNARSGQIYMLVATLFIAGAWLLIKRKSLGGIIAAAICLAALILIRPIAIVLLIPFMLFFRQFKQLLICSIACGFIYALFYLFNPFEHTLLNDYAQGLAEQVKLHQGLGPALQQNDKLTNLTKLEGFDLTQAAKLTADANLPDRTENGNIFVLYHIVKHRYMPLFILNALWAAAMLVACGLYYYKKRKAQPVIAAIIFGLTLYMLTEIFSPVHRFQYNTVQWLPIILVALACMRTYKNFAVLLITAGIILNITNTQLLPMRHTIGELILIYGLLTAVYNNNLLKETERGT